MVEGRDPGLLHAKARANQVVTTSPSLTDQQILATRIEGLGYLLLSLASEPIQRFSRQVNRLELQDWAPAPVLKLSEE